jgi:tRNA(fMet)-specific endonuclease VapC
MAGSRLLLDTNAAIAWIAEDSSLFGGLSLADRPVLSYVTVGELRHGAFNSGRVVANLATIDRTLEVLDVLFADMETTAHYGRLCTALRRIGRPIPQSDIWIAALALQHNLPLATRDAHFQHVEGLRVVGW